MPVKFNSNRNMWQAWHRVEGKKQYLGWFTSKSEADRKVFWAIQKKAENKMLDKDKQPS